MSLVLGIVCCLEPWNLDPLAGARHQRMIVVNRGQVRNASLFDVCGGTLSGKNENTKPVDQRQIRTMLWFIGTLIRPGQRKPIVFPPRAINGH